jgi:hypothetical protein
MRRRVEPQLESLQRRAQLSLPPREVLAERARRQIAGLLERPGEIHSARRVREAATPYCVRFQDRGAIERDAPPHEWEPVGATHDVDTAVHRLEARVAIPCGRRRAGARRCHGCQRGRIGALRNCSRRRGQSKYERGEGLGNHHCAVGELDAHSSRILRTPAAKFTFRFVFRTRMRQDEENLRAADGFGDLVEGFRVLD